MKVKTTTCKYSMSTQDFMSMVVEALDIPVGVPGQVRINFVSQRHIEVNEDGSVSLYHGEDRHEPIDMDKHLIIIETVEVERDEIVQ
jgi:hypothetical protein